jgi:hypothetical protein
VPGRLGIQASRAGGHDFGQPPPGLPFVGVEVVHPERDELALTEGQVHPAGLGVLQLG